MENKNFTFMNGSLIEKYAELMQNNIPEFCTLENVDDCVSYLSQELSALGYPSIYSEVNPCPYSVHCDIVKFLNVSHDLVQKYQDVIHCKDDVEDKNRSLLSEVHFLQKKLGQMKNNVEQCERKISCGLERERQLNEKCDRLSFDLKSEKEEVRKLTSQAQQQKTAFKHEVRKSENKMEQMKGKMVQLLADKNPKKLAGIEISHQLQRNNGQRGKWQTGAVANTHLEEMYNSVIAGYESRYEYMSRELTESSSLLKYVHDQVSQLVNMLKGGESIQTRNVPSPSIEHDFCLIFKINSRKSQEDFQKDFSFLREHIAEYISKKITGEDSQEMKGNVSPYKEVMNELKELGQVTNLGIDERKILEEELEKLEKEKEILAMEKKIISSQKMELGDLASMIEKEKEAIKVQQLEQVQFAMKHKSEKYGLSSLPSLCVLTTSDGLMVPNDSQLSSAANISSEAKKSHLPAHLVIDTTMENRWLAKSDSALFTRDLDAIACIEGTSKSAGNSPPVTNPSLDLPKWVTKNSNTPVVLNVSASNSDVAIGMDSLSVVESEISNTSSSEEQNLLNLQAVAEDLEQKRCNQGV